MKYLSVTDPKYISENNEYIHCRVHFVDLGIIDFVASSNDCETHSKEIYYKAKSGIFGPIKPYTPTVIPVPSNEDLAGEIRRQRNSLLVEIDKVVLNPFRFAELSDQDKAELAQYRKQLLDITKQDDFPLSVTWPTLPSLIGRPIVEHNIISE